MALAQSKLTRAVDASGDDVRTLLDGTIEVQAAGLIGDAGEHVGIDSDPLIVSPRALSRSSTGGALEATHNAKNIAGTFFRVYMQWGAIGIVYLQLFDLAAAPTPGAVPILRGQAMSIEAGGGDTVYDRIIVPEGLAMANGIQVGMSSTLATFTSAGATGAFDVFFL